MLGQIIKMLHQLALDAFGLLLAVLCGAPETPPEPPAAPEQAQLAPAAAPLPSRFEFAPRVV